MKRVLSLVFALLILSTVFVFPLSAQAATKDDLVATIKATKLGHYFTVAAENSLRLINFTEEQGDQLVQIVKDVDNIVVADLGPSAHLYPEDQQEAVMAKLAEACAVLNFTYKISTSANPVHGSDYEFYIYDQDGNLVGTFDGDLWHDQGEVWFPNSEWKPGDDYRPGAETAYGGLLDINMLIGGIAVLVLAGVAFIVVKKVRKSSDAAA